MCKMLGTFDTIFWVKYEVEVAFHSVVVLVGIRSRRVLPKRGSAGVGTAIDPSRRSPDRRTSQHTAETTYTSHAAR